MKKDTSDTRLSKIGISNFLSFDNQSPVKLGSLNIFVGKNSSGKSTVLHALALLSETMYDPSEQTGMLLSGNGINLGTFENVVHKNDISNPIKFDLSFSSTSSPAYDRLTLNLKGEANDLRLGISTMTGYKAQRRSFVIQGKSGGAASFIKNKSSISKPSWITCRFDHFLPISPISAHQGLH
ncbi:AAA family ATPase [Bdellovibrio bacteriovorus]|uniref:Endonuclease GajA/Old nuclease/RecF-like AAA domain-containing protein n=1 Tax=Bdellovibrio bacteriovorus TaxID=959 RepID=A0A1Z3N5X5_BDEBC|nr:AAA family ATPase [Bdellovibrio bacteriovorus]ASD62811.1 hypothetical protein B9G79_04135 [Bdellovibrio bacteriovorus]